MILKLVIPMFPFPIEVDFNTYTQIWSNPRWMVEHEYNNSDFELNQKLKNEHKNQYLTNLEYSNYLKVKTNRENYHFQAKKLIRKAKLLKVKSL